MKNKYLAGARISEAKFRLILRFFAADVPALTATKLCAANYRTIYRLYSLLGHHVARLALAESGAKLAGEVEVDESYFGPRRVRGKRGRGAGGKLPVIGRHKRGAGVYVSVVKDCSKRELLSVICGHVLSDSDVYTDGWRACDGLVTAGFALPITASTTKLMSSPGARRTSMAARASGASPSFASSSGAACGPISSCSISRNASGASTTMAETWIVCSSSIYVKNPSQLHKTLTN